jgi:hypothetical protein
MNATKSLTVDQRSNFLGFPKPGEMIDMVGTHTLEASDRAIVNILYQHAHDSGKLAEVGAEWEIPLGIVRDAFSKHESSDRLGSRPSGVIRQWPGNARFCRPGRVHRRGPILA